MKLILTAVLLLTFFISKSQTPLLYVDFETELQSYTISTTGSQNWGITGALYSTGNNCIRGQLEAGESSTLQIVSFSTTGETNIKLSFDHICKINFFDYATINVSVDNGNSWTQLSESNYLGNGQFGNQSDRFSSNAYPVDWDMLDDSEVPLNTWWKSEVFDISQIAANKASVMIQFVLKDGDYPTMGGYGWLIDNLKVENMLNEFVPPDISIDILGNPETNGPFFINATVTDASTIKPVSLSYTFTNSSGTQSYGPFTISLSGGMLSYTTVSLPCVSSDVIEAIITAEDQYGNTASETKLLTIQKSPAAYLPEYIIPFTPIPGKKYVLSAWVRESNTEVSTYSNAKIEISYLGPSQVDVCQASGPMIEGWQRIEQVFTIPSNATQISIDLVNNSSTLDVFFDDIRVFPFDANMKSYVYDYESERFIAELDNNNFATFYEYDEEGVLIRVKKETERGVMTIKETRNNTKK